MVKPDLRRKRSPEIGLRNSVGYFRINSFIAMYIRVDGHVYNYLLRSFYGNHKAFRLK